MIKRTVLFTFLRHNTKRHLVRDHCLHYYTQDPTGSYWQLSFLMAYWHFSYPINIDMIVYNIMIILVRLVHTQLINSDQHIRYWRDIAHSYSSACGQLGCFNDPVRPVGSQLWLWSLFLWTQTDGPKGDFTEFVTIGGSLARPAKSNRVVLFVCKFSSLWQKRQVWQVSIDFVKVIKMFGK